MAPRHSVWVLGLAGALLLLLSVCPPASAVGPPSQQWLPGDGGVVIGDPPSGGGGDGGDGGDADELGLYTDPVGLPDSGSETDRGTGSNQGSRHSKARPQQAVRMDIRTLLVWLGFIR